MDHQLSSQIAFSTATELEKQLLLKKLFWKILPILFIAYFFSFLDRVNIGYAKLQMQDAIGFTDSQYAFAAGIFFIGYAFFEIPSNILMDKIGARKTLARIMILWGLASAATMLVSSATQLYVLRLMLGIFEAGFFPGVILYLSFWFPSYMRGRVTSILILATLTAPIIGGPISGLIMTHMNGFHGLGGWQWMFLLEALPIILIGFVCLFYLTDKPGTSRWLSPQERQLHKQIMTEDAGPDAQDSKINHSGKAVLKCLTDYRVYLLASLAFAAYCGSYGFNFWLPTMIKEMGVTDIAQISFYAMIPFSLAAVGMITVGRSSDKRRERRWHYTISMLFGAAMMCLAAFWTGDMISRLIILGLAGFGFSGGVVVAWSLPAAYLEGKTAAAGIAMVSTLATMSGLFAPWAIGFARELTGTNEAALLTIAGVMVLAALIMAFLIPAKAVYVSDKK
ncbi:MFS transporter [Acinetobacter sp. NCu2D-2]|uniref:MFS transporter n=1 Tax=Acinetobacter sp. NCu2D-2 TaxID=1608473 RepID=UPI0007CDA62F|nr:MFS transporter [Acinetobacter sp. NCu2D-2]ANF81261.1 MFS transporter [Acinetobacter sp. NCu2D-2]